MNWRSQNVRFQHDAIHTVSRDALEASRTSVSIRAVNRIPYKLYVWYRHTGAVPYWRLLSKLTTITVSGW